LIELAGATESACRAIFHCSDGHRETLSLADLLGCDAFLALSSDQQGIEDQRRVRLVVPGKFGERWAKYVERIELVAEA
jgi:DMSO/TMAO reductase YedYZ molybdopterin-dependent catalytic subunit